MSPLQPSPKAQRWALAWLITLTLAFLVMGCASPDPPSRECKVTPEYKLCWERRGRRRRRRVVAALLRRSGAAPTPVMIRWLAHGVVWRHADYTPDMHEACERAKDREPYELLYNRPPSEGAAPQPVACPHPKWELVGETTNGLVDWCRECGAIRYERWVYDSVTKRHTLTHDPLDYPNRAKPNE